MNDPIKRKVIFSAEPRAELYLGDCLEILPLVGKVDVVVTDAPFGISDAPIQGQDRTGKRVGAVNIWHPESDWDASINPSWCRAVCSIAPTVAWFGHWRKRSKVESAMSHPIRGEIVWAKDCHVGPPCPLAMADERIWLFSAFGIQGRVFETSVWNEPIIPTWAHKRHKNEKPFALMARLIRWLIAAGEMVCDPFMGSGTTGVACMKLGRRFIGIEIDPGYFEIAVRRITEAREEVANRLPFEEPKRDEQLSLIEP